MNYVVSKKTEDYIEQLKQKELFGQTPIPYHSNLDAIDQLILENNLQIEGISFYPKIDLMLVVLNNRKILKRNLSDFKRLQSATISQLDNFEISPMGVHWIELDEDLSIRGFLKYELAFVDSPQVV